MPKLSGLLKQQHCTLAHSIYYERQDVRESAFEGVLRGLLGRLPRLNRHAQRMRQFVAKINALESDIRPLDDVELEKRFKLAATEMSLGGFTERALIPVFAIIREAATRTFGLRLHDVQLMGGWALLQGQVAEMATGEGKTLVAVLAACAAARSGAAVHVITVNDYLAQRDAAFSKPLYEFLGLRVGIIEQGLSPDQRRSQYACDVVYVSNKEIVFDYLKDRVAAGALSASHYRLRQLYRPETVPRSILRGLHVAIVDEADSILIDESRTPLIISETQANLFDDAFYQTAISRAKMLAQSKDFDLTPQREITLTASGKSNIKELTADLGGVWDTEIWRHELMEKALSALWCYERDRHYIIQDNKVQIVDEFTGRVMADRSWEQGLHQMIEAKENCTITGQRKTLSRITYQRFFRRYLLLSGMTGTASEVVAELRKVYDLSVIPIATHRPCQRARLQDQVWLNADERWAAVADHASARSRAGQPVLVGTRSVEASEHLSHLLAQRQIEHTVLNARQDRDEADIVAYAGQSGRVTVATNMAGRGTDIKIDDAAARAGGLHVILTEFHESSRVDRQLFGRCARQGEPGTSIAMVCTEDELFSRYGPWLTGIFRLLIQRNRKFAPRLLTILVWHTQAVAEKMNARIRIDTLKHDRKLQSLLAFSGAPI